MAKLYYWIAEINDDAQAYSLIGKTKKDVLAQMKDFNPDRFEKPERRVIYYSDAFDLFKWVTSEGGGRNCGQKPN